LEEGKQELSRGLEANDVRVDAKEVFCRLKLKTELGKWYVEFGR
jgi:hypothetical protein